MRKWTVTLALIGALALTMACGSALKNFETAEAVMYNSTKAWCEFEYANRALCDQVLGPKSHEVTNQIRIDLQTYEPQLLAGIKAYSDAIDAAENATKAGDPTALAAAQQDQIKAKARILEVSAALNKAEGAAAANTALMLAHPTGAKALNSFKVAKGGKK